ncbi:MAG TPA: MFS transporter [Bacillus sp. (in: firmicutes)]|nr:MFS transporter [Bacillus sp. (in: firmicutes)]
MKEKIRIRLILFLLMLCVLASLGFARFSFGAILPFMKDGLNFTYQETGFVASGIFLGYLLSSFFSGYFVIKYTAKRVILFSFMLAAVSMMIISFSDQFWMAVLGSLILGISSGGANIPALGIVSRWFASSHRGIAMGIVNSGSGIGMVFSGLIIPLLVSIEPQSGWRYSWMLLALFIVLILIINALLLKNDPKEVGMKPVGYSCDPPGVPGKVDELVQSSSVYKNKSVWLVGFTYMAWGFSYLIFSTFLVDYLMTDADFDKTKAGHYFAVGGFVSVFSGFIWGGISDKLGRVRTLSIVYLYQAILLVMMVLTNHSALLLLEITLYGLSLWAAPTVTSVSISEFVQPRLVPIALGFSTLFFGIGQFISPIVTGVLIDRTGSYSIAFFVSAAAVAIGSLISILFYSRYSKKKIVYTNEKII